MQSESGKAASRFSASAVSRRASARNARAAAPTRRNSHEIVRRLRGRPPVHARGTRATASAEAVGKKGRDTQQGGGPTRRSDGQVERRAPRSPATGGRPAPY